MALRLSRLWLKQPDWRQYSARGGNRRSLFIGRTVPISLIRDGVPSEEALLLTDPRLAARFDDTAELRIVDDRPVASAETTIYHAAP